MVWTIDQPIRVGDNVTNLMLGQLALEIDALHTGFTTNTNGSGGGVANQPVAQVLDTPQGILANAGVTNPPYIIYSFTTGYRRKPPYLIVATFGANRPTTLTFRAWIVRQPHYVADAGREDTATASATNNFATELTYNSIVSNIEPSLPDGYFQADSTNDRVITVARAITEEIPARYQYSNGTTLTYFEDYFHIAVAPSGGSTANPIVITNPRMTIYGGR